MSRRLWTIPYRGDSPTQRTDTAEYFAHGPLRHLGPVDRGAATRVTLPCRRQGLELRTAARGHSGQQPAGDRFDVRPSGTRSSISRSMRSPLSNWRPANTFCSGRWRRRPGAHPHHVPTGSGRRIGRPVRCRRSDAHRRRTLRIPGQRCLLRTPARCQRYLAGLRRTNAGPV